MDQQTSRVARAVVLVLIVLVCLAALAMAVLNWVGLIPVNRHPL